MRGNQTIKLLLLFNLQSPGMRVIPSTMCYSWYSGSQCIHVSYFSVQNIVFLLTSNHAKVEKYFQRKYCTVLASFLCFSCCIHPWPLALGWILLDLIQADHSCYMHRW